MFNKRFKLKKYKLNTEFKIPVIYKGKQMKSNFKCNLFKDVTKTFINECFLQQPKK